MPLSRGLKGLIALVIGFSVLSLISLPDISQFSSQRPTSIIRESRVGEVVSEVYEPASDPEDTAPSNHKPKGNIKHDAKHLRPDVSKNSLQKQIELLRNEFTEALKPELVKTFQLLNDASVWPIVRGKSFGDAELLIAGDFRIIVAQDTDAGLSEAVAMFEKEVLNGRLRRSATLSKCVSDDSSVTNSSMLSFLLIELAPEFEANAPIPTLKNEKYELFTTTHGGGIIRVYSRFALIRALATFAQLLPAPSSLEKDECSRPRIASVKAPFLIIDQPAFAYRGLLLDTARSFYSVDSVIRIVRTLAMTKMNVLHWHFVDDQSYGFESKAIPGITISTYLDDVQNEKTYSLADVKKIVEEGRKWGVRIIPELDMPSHSAGWIQVEKKNLLGTNGEPMLTNCPRYTCHHAWGIAMHPYSNTTWTVIEKILKEMTELFPDPELHLGGDEVFKACWEEDQTIMGISRHSDVHWAHFERRLERIVETLNRSTIRWDDCRRFYDDGVVQKKDNTFQVWQGWGDLSWIPKAMDKGYGIIPSVRWYLDNDCMSWEECYQANPLQGVQLSMDYINRPGLKGLEACAWELSEKNLDTENLWMRFLGVSEQMWSTSDFASGGSTRGNFVVMDASGKTRRRIMALCEMLTEEMGLFPKTMCSPQANTKKITIKRDREFLVRAADRDVMMCRRAAPDPTIPCTTHNCIREKMN